MTLRSIQDKQKLYREIRKHFEVHTIKYISHHSSNNIHHVQPYS